MVYTIFLFVTDLNQLQTKYDLKKDIISALTNNTTNDKIIKVLKKHLQKTNDYNCILLKLSNITIKQT